MFNLKIHAKKGKNAPIFSSIVATRKVVVATFPKWPKIGGHPQGGDLPPIFQDLWVPLTLGHFGKRGNNNFARCHNTIQNGNIFIAGTVYAKNVKNNISKKAEMQKKYAKNVRGVCLDKPKGGTGHKWNR